MSKKNIKEEEKVEVVGEALGTVDTLLSAYKGKIIGGIVAVLVIVIAFFAYTNLYKLPRENKALEEMAMAERYFEIDSFAIALNGDGSHLGFIQIIDEYGSSKAGKLANFYAGYCNLNLGNFQDAINNLKNFNGKDEIIQARAYCGIGDAYTELGQYDEAASYFMKAANYRNNEFSPSYLLKAGLTYERLEKLDDALKAYKKIKTDYINTIEAQEIDKYIERVEIKKIK